MNQPLSKIPVSANKGEYIFDQVMTSNDFGDCSNQTIRTINFQLKDSQGKILIYTVIIGHFLLYSREWKKI